jgi:hypothetical protein
MLIILLLHLLLLHLLLLPALELELELELMSLPTWDIIMESSLGGLISRR